jgi:hypothetical protein
LLPTLVALKNESPKKMNKFSAWGERVVYIGEANKNKTIMELVARREREQAVLSTARGLFIAKLRIWTGLLETWLARVGGKALGAAIRESVGVEQDWKNEYACRTRRARLEAALAASMMDASTLAREEQAYGNMKEAQGAMSAAMSAVKYTDALLAVPSHAVDYDDDAGDSDEAGAGGAGGDEEEEEDAATAAEMARPLNLNREQFETYTRLLRLGLREERRREQEQQREAQRRLPSYSTTNNYYHQRNNNNNDDGPINRDFAHRLGFL